MKVSLALNCQAIESVRFPERIFRLSCVVRDFDVTAASDIFEPPVIAVHSETAPTVAAPLESAVKVISAVLAIADVAAGVVK
jgi:hypothetical protein